MNKGFNTISYLFYPIYMLIFFIGMLGYQITVFLGYPLVALIVISSLHIMATDIKNKNYGKSIMVLWMAYNVLSVVLYSINGMPLACYVWALQNYFFPLLFFFVGNWYEENNDKYYSIFLKSCAFFFIVGLYLYYTMPSYYLAFLAKVNENAWYASGDVVTEDQLLMGQRFSSFSSSSYDTSALSVSCLICTLGYIINRPHKTRDVYLYALALISFACAILSLQRIAMACSVIVLVVFSIYGYRNRHKGIMRMSVALTIIGVLVLGLTVADERVSTIFDMLNGRLEEMNFKVAMDGRSGQVERAMGEIFSYIITGKGMGAGGHAATMNGGIGIHDNGYFNLLLEFGVIGLGIFLWLMGSTVLRGIKHFREYNVEIAIVIYYLLCNIGENVFSQSYFITPIFWFCIGRIWNMNYYQRRKQETGNNGSNRILSASVSSYSA